MGRLNQINKLCEFLEFEKYISIYVAYKYERVRKPNT